MKVKNYWFQQKVYTIPMPNNFCLINFIIFIRKNFATLHCSLQTNTFLLLYWKVSHSTSGCSQWEQSGATVLWQERGVLKVHGLLSRKGRAFMITPFSFRGLTSTDAETSSAWLLEIKCLSFAETPFMQTTG